MDINRKRWNVGQQKLKQALAAGNRETALEIFLLQHAMLHAAKMTRSGLWSFEDEALEGLTDAQVRAIPSGGEHSIAWILLHLARIEDITMNMLVAGKGQVFMRGGWAKKMNLGIVHSANKLNGTDMAELSAQINVRALKAYRLAVGRRTRQVVQVLKADDFKRRADPVRLQRVLDEGAVIPEAIEVVHYWGTRTIAGLLLMPATRHNLLHLDEAGRIRKRLTK